MLSWVYDENSCVFKMFDWIEKLKIVWGFYITEEKNQFMCCFIDWLNVYLLFIVANTLWSLNWLVSYSKTIALQNPRTRLIRNIPFHHITLRPRKIETTFSIPKRKMQIITILHKWKYKNVSIILNLNIPSSPFQTQFFFTIQKL